jgi:hypothetical protein
LEQAPIHLRKAGEELTDFAVILSHRADLRDQFLADVLGDGLLFDLGGEMEAALGGILVQGALEEVQDLGYLVLDLVAAEPQGIMLFAHMYAYIYAYITADKSACQRDPIGKVTK